MQCKLFNQFLLNSLFSTKHTKISSIFFSFSFSFLGGFHTRYGQVAFFLYRQTQRVVILITSTSSGQLSLYPIWQPFPSDFFEENSRATNSPKGKFNKTIEQWKNISYEVLNFVNLQQAHHYHDKEQQNIGFKFIKIFKFMTAMQINNFNPMILKCV